jgi:UDP-glucose:(heptosyl)LPS alpha-1,3-glucosyltransferase
LPKTVSVRFLGPIEDVRPVLWSSDLFALPSIYDPSPNALLEALACGLPVICTDSVGYADEVLAAGCGLISTREPEDVQKSIETLFRSIRSSSALSSAARSLALKHSWDSIIKDWMHLHKSLLESRR